MRQLFVTIFLMFGLLSMAHAQSREAYRDEKVERELIELVHAWDTASVNHDVAALDRMLAAEFTLSGTPRADYLAFVKSPTTLITSEVSDNFDVRVYKDTAVLIARDTITLQRKSVMVVEVYRYIDVWVKRAGRWQCVATESYEVKKQ